MVNELLNGFILPPGTSMVNDVLETNDRWIDARISTCNRKHLEIKLEAVVLSVKGKEGNKA